MVKLMANIPKKEEKVIEEKEEEKEPLFEKDQLSVLDYLLQIIFTKLTLKITLYNQFII